MSSVTRWAQVWRASTVARPWAARERARSGVASTAAMCDIISAPERATRRSRPGSKRRSTSSQGAETSGMPHASASNGRIVGLPGSSRA